jgi:uncharacterized protein (TIGR02271 family)
MADSIDLQKLTPGMSVVGADGEKVGDVAGFQGGHLVVSKGFFFPTDYFIPVGEIGAVTDRVHLNVTKEQALNRGWDTPPADTTSSEGSADELAAVDAGLHLDNPVDAYHVMPEPEPVDTVAGAGARDANAAVTVPLHEEELRAGTRDVTRGQARVDKVVTDAERSLDVPVTEEYVTVRRDAVDRQVKPGDTVFTEETIELPLRGEEVVVDKDIHIIEEVEIGTEVVERTERVRGTVRREEARVYDEEGNLVETTENGSR